MHSQIYFTKPAQARTPIRLNGRTVASVHGDALTVTHYRTRHFLKSPPAIAFNVEVIEQAERAGAVWIEVTEKEQGRLYRVSLAKLRRLGYALNAGYGQQVALPLRHWSVEPLEAGAPRQPGLFDDPGGGR